MKHFILFVFLCMACLTIHAQEENLLSVGEKMDGTDLKAECYTFPQRVETFSVDPSLEFLCLNFRETTKSGKYLKSKGEIGLYRIADKELMWKSPIDYLTTRVSCIKQGVLLTTAYETSLLDKATGTERWKNTFYPVYKDDSLNILIGYRAAYSNTLRAISLDYGIQFWETKIPHKFGWNQVYPLNGTKRLIVADDISELDLQTGAKVVCEVKTGVADTKMMLLQGLSAVAGAAAGAAITGGAYAYSYVPTGNNVITGLVSNVWMADSCYYVADRENLMRLDSSLQPVWKSEFPGVKASHSVLFGRGDKLYMLNYGFGLRSGGGKVKSGRPFIAGYDCQSGNQLFFNQLSLKKDIVEDALIANDAIYMLFDNGLSYQAFTDSVVNITPWDVERYGKLLGILSDTIYVFNKERKDFMPLSFDGVNCPVLTDLGQIYVIDKDLQIRQEYSAEDIYLPDARLKDYLCVSKENDYWFIHKLGMPVAHLKMNVRRKVAIDNRLLVLTDQNQLMYIDMDKAVR